MKKKISLCIKNLNLVCGAGYRHESPGDSSPQTCTGGGSEFQTALEEKEMKCDQVCWAATGLDRAEHTGRLGTVMRGVGMGWILNFLQLSSKLLNEAVTKGREKRSSSWFTQ